MTKRRAFRLVSLLVLTTFSSMYVQPTVAAIRSYMAVEERASTFDEEYRSQLEGLKASARALAERDSGFGARQPDTLVRSLVGAAGRLGQLDARIDSRLSDFEAHLNAIHASDGMLRRHLDLIEKIRRARMEFSGLINAVETAHLSGSDVRKAAASSALVTYLSSEQVYHRKLDAKNLPWRSPRPTSKEPIATQVAFDKLSLPRSRPIGGGPKVSPGNEDLSASEDVQFSTQVVAKSQELEGSPSKIFDFVRNNIDFVPTYGSVQGSDATLAHRRGNSFDIASLLIALLRVSGIPARYAYGTVEIDSNRIVNWIGVDTPEAALAVLAQGGIPAVSISSGGRVVAVRFEHMWVEAWLPYFPSRGAVANVQANMQWIPLDASFKQFTIAPGTLSAANLPFDPAAFMANVQAGAVVNQQEGWTQGVNQQRIQEQLAGYQSQLSSFVQSSNPDATIGDLVGARTIQSETTRIFPGTLRLKVVAQGPRYSALPDSLRHKFRYSLYASSEDRAADNPVWTYQSSLPSLIGKRVVLSFRPATQEDADLVASFLPKPHQDGSPIQLSEFPSSLPPYVNVVPQLTVDGAVVASGGTFSLGSSLAGLGGFTDFNLSGWDLSPDDTLIAGQVSAFGMSMQGADRTLISALTSRLSSAKAKLDASDASPLSGRDLLPDILSSVATGFFSDLQAHGSVASRYAKVIDIPGLSYGLFHAVMQPTRVLGVVITSVSPKGGLLDVGHLRHLRWAKDGNPRTLVSYDRMRGQTASALEAAVPEKFFNDLTSCTPQGIPGDANLPTCTPGFSAATALAMAQSNGQRIYVIGKSNQQVLSALPITDETRSELQDAVAAGQEVTIHEAPVTVGGWTGFGFSVIDPETGAGAYLIEGHANGGAFLGLALGLLAGLAVILLAFTGLGLIASVAGFLAGFIFEISHSSDEVLDFKAAQLIGLMAGIVLAIILFEYVIVSFSALFVLGLIALTVSTVALLIKQLIVALKKSTA